MILSNPTKAACVYFAKFIFYGMVIVWYKKYLPSVLYYQRIWGQSNLSQLFQIAHIHSPEENFLCGEAYLRKKK